MIGTEAVAESVDGRVAVADDVDVAVAVEDKVDETLEETVFPAIEGARIDGFAPVVAAAAPAAAGLGVGVVTGRGCDIGVS